MALKLTFNSDLDLQEEVRLKMDIASSPNWPAHAYFRWLPDGVSPNGQSIAVRKVPNETTPGVASAKQFVKAYNKEYSSNTGKVERDGRDVIIYLDTSAASWTDVLSGTSNKVSYEEITYVFLEFQSITYTSGSSCDKIKLNVKTNEQVDKILSPVNQNVSSNPFEISLDRGKFETLTVKVEDVEKSIGIKAPDKLTPSGITIGSKSTPVDTQITISNSLDGLDLEYSLDGNNWDASNMFPGLEDGTYTLYIRDQFGCEIEKDFSVSFVSFDSPYVHLSVANSIRYKRDIEWADCGEYKNEYNTLSCEESVRMPYKYIQTFQTCDIVTEQIKSSFPEINVKANDDNIPVIQITQNMGKSDYRDAKTGSRENGKIGVYFSHGDRYDPITENKIGEYDLTGALPIWGKVGEFLKYGGSWYEIEDIILDEVNNALLLIVESNSIPEGASIKVLSEYNIENYEVYQYTIDFGNYNGERVQVFVNNTGGSFDDVDFLSEEIEVRPRWQNTIEVKWSNRDNTDVLFSTGIEFMGRFEVEEKNAGFIDESENLRGDDSVRLLSQQMYPSSTFVFPFLTTGMVRKIAVALSHSEVYIDGIKYVKEEMQEPEREGEMESVNLYRISATMVRADVAFNKGRFGGTSTGVEIPALVESGDGYVEL